MTFDDVLDARRSSWATARCCRCLDLRHRGFI